MGEGLFLFGYIHIPKLSWNIFGSVIIAIRSTSTPKPKTEILLIASWDAPSIPPFRTNGGSCKYQPHPKSWTAWAPAGWRERLEFLLCGGLFRRALDYIAQRPPALLLASANLAMVPFFTTQQGILAPLWRWGWIPGVRGCGAQIDNCVHWLSVPNPTSFIMLGSFVPQKEIMQWTVEEMGLQ